MAVGPPVAPAPAPIPVVPSAVAVVENVGLAVLELLSNDEEGELELETVEEELLLE